MGPNASPKPLTLPSLGLVIKKIKKLASISQHKNILPDVQRVTETVISPAMMLNPGKVRLLSASQANACWFPVGQNLDPLHNLLRGLNAFTVRHG